MRTFRNFSTAHTHTHTQIFIISIIIFIVFPEFYILLSKRTIVFTTTTNIYIAGEREDGDVYGINKSRRARVYDRYIHIY